MSLLELTATELQQKIDAELARNPALELVEEHRCPTCQRALFGNNPCPICSYSAGSSADQPIVFLSSREDFPNSKTTSSTYLDLSDENQFPMIEELPEYVLRQVVPELQPAEYPIAAYLLTNLSEDGLLSVPLVEIARYHHVPLELVQKVSRIIQHADPLGVGSATPQEALLVQLEALREMRSTPPMVETAIREGLDLLSHHKYPELARLLHIPVPQAVEIARFISENLYPFPARAHWGENNQSYDGHPATRNVYHFPDIIISRLNDREDTPLVVEVTMPYCGMLRVNPLFREALEHAPGEKSDLWRADLEQAALLVKCLQQRNHTIVRLMQRLTVFQRAFILHGDAYLLPSTRANMAHELNVHESTVSRAVSAKTIQLPNLRIVPLAIFFDRSLHIRTALKQIIQQEIIPLTDTEIAGRLSNLGFSIARRTVAKYRSMEGILPAHLRTPLGHLPAFSN
jgi:RNA polymerase sigma-54 factor